MSIRKLEAYEVIEARRIEDVNSMSYVLRHKKSGARIAILSNDDDNKVFYIGFRTTPTDETGVPHIIEHTTLCGSKKFPVKDPFVELVKGSLNTFLNAMTYPDKTVYPVASYNDKDFKNLMDVYMDAVFNPNITKYKEIFKQEGWHLELENKEDPVTINGVVYNEMKGAYSSPDEVLQNRIYKTLFPDNTYSKDSGGNPEFIPTLTYEAYLDFYHKFYHPSNSYIYMYGDMDVEERLKWLDKEYLCNYDYEEIDSEIPLQKAFDKVKCVSDEYSITEEDPLEDATYLSYNRVIGKSTDKDLYLAFDILDYALVSSSGAPIRKALIEAGIGEDVYGSFDSGVLQPVFSIVAKNANESDYDKFIEIINKVLTEQVMKGINKESLLAGINSQEFRFREADYGQYPKGLIYGLNCLDTWNFDDNEVFSPLECLEVFDDFKKRIDDRYFENLIKIYLLDNTHGANVTVKPKRGLNEAKEKALEEKLEAYKNSLSDQEIEKLIEETKALKAYQDEPSSDEDLMKIPMLTRDDMRKEALDFSNFEDYVSDIKVIRHDEWTNGINYLTLLFDASDVSMEELSYLSLLSSIHGAVDTNVRDYNGLTNAINIYTGGIIFGLNTYTRIDEDDHILIKYEVKIKTLEANLKKALSLVEEILTSSKLQDVKRLSEIVSQIKSRLQVVLSSTGHSVAAIRALSNFSRYGKYTDVRRGIEFYRFICKVDELLKTNPKEVTDKLEQLVDKIISRNRLIISFTGTKKSFEEAAPKLDMHLSFLEKKEPVGKAVDLVFSKKNEGFTDASQIQYVARAGNYKKHGFDYTGHLKILRMIMGYDYLWLNVRVKGGAYGCMNMYYRSGDSYFVSYRDPNLEATNEIYEGIPEYLDNFNPSERDMTKFIIGTFGSIDTPLNPEAKGVRSITAYLQGVTFDMIQKERDEILSASAEDIRQLAGLIRSVLEDECICAIGNEKKIKDASGMFDEVNKLV